LEKQNTFRILSHNIKIQDMLLFQILIIYILGGIIINIYAEYIMKGDSQWTIDSRILLFVFWPLFIYALTL
jgi:hypothetical protein